MTTLHEFLVALMVFRHAVTGAGLGQKQCRVSVGGHMDKAGAIISLQVHV